MGHRRENVFELQRRRELMCLAHFVFIIKVFFGLDLTFTTQLPVTAAIVMVYMFAIALMVWIFSWGFDRLHHGICSVTLLTGHNLLLEWYKFSWSDQISFLSALFREHILWGLWLLLAVPQDPPPRMYIPLERV